MALAISLRLAVGRLGEVELAAGLHSYVGSAFGPGGVWARCAHHRRATGRPRWHIDYLRPHVQLVAIWYTYDPVRREHEWVERLVILGGSFPVPGFGSSDCSCPAHLLWFPRRLGCSRFRASLAERFPDHARVRQWTREL